MFITSTRNIKPVKPVKKLVGSIVLIWGLLILSIARMTIFARRRATGDFDVVDTSALYAILLICLLGVVLVLNKRTISVLRYGSKRSISWLLLYFVLCFISAFWSWNIAFTAFRSVEILVILIAALVAMSYSDHFIQAEKAFLRFAMLSMFFAFFVRVQGGFSWASLHTNLYSIMAGMGFIYCFGEVFRAKNSRRIFLVKYATVFLVFLVLGTSAASNISTAMAFMVVLSLLRTGKMVILAIIFVTFFILYLSGSLEGLILDVLLPGKDIEMATTLHGRGYLWTAYWNLFLDNPIYGYGYAVVARYGVQFGILSTTNAHNGVLEVILGTGLIGLSVFIFWILRLAKELLVAYQRAVPGAVGAIGAFVVIMINNMSKSIVGGALDVSFVVFSVFLGFILFHIHGETVRQRRLKMANVKSMRRPQNRDGINASAVRT